MARNPLCQIDGPFYAESVRQGDPYELSNGHPIVCAHAGSRSVWAQTTCPPYTTIDGVEGAWPNRYMQAALSPCFCV